ncbi:flagellar hook assembly protein FlgD [Gallaecimonas sp. GXIMD4217]|uniref:flagellar hook assembly protein FlgD n=1 Tax=Gallaecimonas sp. GXIMD4217 TaxID=3131927 RepID=UPI00311B1F61
MSTINGSSDPLNALKWGDQTQDVQNNNGSLDQEDFLALLTKQLAYQDPFKPVDNDQMIAQMASFATVDGINNMNDQFGSLNEVMSSNQALQASTLVGQKVLVPTNVGYLPQGGSITGAITSEYPMQNLTLRIEDEDGNLIKTVELDDQGAGNTRFEWDGTNFAGEQAKSGTYVVKAQALVNGERVDLPVVNYAKVESVTLGSAANGGVILNLQGLGGIQLGDVLEVAKA